MRCGSSLPGGRRKGRCDLLTDFRIQGTIKTGPEYDASWLTFGADDPDEFVTLLIATARKGALEALKGCAMEFQGKQAQSPVDIVQDAFPGSQVVQDDSYGYEPGPSQGDSGPATIAQPRTASGYQPQARSVNQGQAYTQGSPQGDLNPPCTTCGGPTRFKSGNGQKGPWSGYFCINTERAPKGQGHKPIWG